MVFRSVPRRVLIALLFLFYPSIIFSQWEGANWYFTGLRIAQNTLSANTVGMINFHFDKNGLQCTTVPVANVSIINNGNPIQASISSPEGQPLFATVRYDSLANGNFEYVNSQSGDFDSYWRSSAENIFIPLAGYVPRKEFYFYLRQTYDISNPTWNAYASLKYSMLDSSLFNGLGGAYFSGRKPPFITDSLSVTSISAAFHINGRDIWLLLQDNYMDFYAVLISPCGEMAPVVYSKNVRNPTRKVVQNVQNMEFNPYSTYFAIVEDSIYNLSLYNFDNSSGLVNFIQLLDTNILSQEHGNGPNGAGKLLAFSPNGEYLYRVSNRYNPIGYVYQYELNPIFNHPGLLPKRYQSFAISSPASLQPGLDGKTYLFYQSSNVKKSGYVGAIAQPNLPFPTNQIDTVAIPLPIGLNINGIRNNPNFVNEFRWPGWKGIQLYIANFSATSLCMGQPAKFEPMDTNFAKMVTWDFGDGAKDTSYSPSHSFADTGIYMVKMRLHLSCYVDSIIKPIKIGKPFIKPNLGNNMTVPCFVPVALSVNPEYNQYSWNTLDTTNSIITTSPGTYFLHVSNSCGSGSDTIDISWKTPDNPPISFKPGFIGISDSCILDTIKYALKDTSGVKSVTWQLGDGQVSKLLAPSHHYLNSGNYNVIVKAFQLCYIDSSFRKIHIDAVPSVSLGKDTSIICGSKLVLMADSGYRTYIWQNGSNLRKYMVNGSGTFFVTVLNNCGSASDSLTVDIKQTTAPNIFTPNGDGKNEEFIFGEYQVGSGLLSISNRWGESVFETNSYNNDWKAENSPDGIYYFNMDTGCQKLRGWVQVIR